MIVYGKNRHLERRLPVSGRERGPLCHPERELWISADVGRDPKLALRMTERTSLPSAHGKSSLQMSVLSIDNHPVLLLQSTV